jgi:hypothetical protein
MKRFEQRAEFKDDEFYPHTRRVWFSLRDYLKPGGRYPYEELAEDLEASVAAGYKTYLRSVPGFMMLAGYPEPDGDGNRWHKTDTDEFHKTAKEALAL